jgi:hypothetical protein
MINRFMINRQIFLKDKGISTDADRKEDRMARYKNLQFVTSQPEVKQ